MSQVELLTRFMDGPATAPEVHVPVTRLKELEAEGLLVRKGERRTGKRGRPAFEFALTPKARKRVKRYVQK